MSTIAQVRATPLNVPLVAPYRFAFGSLASFTTTIVEVADSDGALGIGETPHGDLAALVGRLGERLIGLDVEALNEIEARCVARTGFSLWDEAASERRAFGGIELALWDLRARRAGVPLVELLGGRLRDTVPFTEYFALRHGREETPAQVIDYCLAMAAQFASPLFEGKLGVLDLETELSMVGDLARELGPGRLLRLDANGVYTVPTARLVCRRLAEHGVAWLEDPVAPSTRPLAYAATGRLSRSPHTRPTLHAPRAAACPTAFASISPSLAASAARRTSCAPAPRWASTSGATAATPV